MTPNLGVEEIPEETNTPSVNSIEKDNFKLVDTAVQNESPIINQPPPIT